MKSSGLLGLAVVVYLVAGCYSACYTTPFDIALWIPSSSSSSSVAERCEAGTNWFDQETCRNCYCYPEEQVCCDSFMIPHVDETICDVRFNVDSCSYEITPKKGVNPRRCEATEFTG